MTRLQLAVEGQWLDPSTWGDLEWSTVWPGGSESLSFGTTRSNRLFRPDAIVELMWGGECRWCGTMLDPTRGEPIVAEGLFRKAEDYAALDPAGEVSPGVGAAVAPAISRGLPWRGASGNVSPQPGVSDVPLLDLDQPHTLAQYFDASAQQRGAGWGVNPERYVHVTPWPTTPTFHLLPGVDGLAISRDGYASTLKARYLDSATGTYKTVTGHDQAAEDRWGHVERTIVEPLGESVSMTAAAAQELMDGLIAQGAAQIGWQAPIEVQYGDVVNDYNQPIDLPKITAGQMGWLHGLVEDVADLAGSTRTELYLARVLHKGATATLEPRGLVSPMNDVLAGKTP